MLAIFPLEPSVVGTCVRETVGATLLAVALTEHVSWRDGQEVVCCWRHFWKEVYVLPKPQSTWLLKKPLTLFTRIGNIKSTTSFLVQFMSIFFMAFLLDTGFFFVSYHDCCHLLLISYSLGHILTVSFPFPFFPFSYLALQGIGLNPFILTVKVTELISCSTSQRNVKDSLWQSPQHSNPERDLSIMQGQVQRHLHQEFKGNDSFQSVCSDSIPCSFLFVQSFSSAYEGHI